MENSTTIKGRIAWILGIDATDDWYISDDSNGYLYMVHYTTNANLDKYGMLRGVVVDIEEGVVVCPSIGYTPTAITDELAVGHSNTYLIRDKYGYTEEIHKDNAKFKIGFDGEHIRVFKYKGQVYHCNYNRLDIAKVKFGNSISYMDMYIQLGGPEDDSLFPDGDSPHCYMFIIVHPQLLNVTKQDIGPGFIVYLGSVNTYRSSTTIKPVELDLPYNIPNKVERAGVYALDFVGLEEVNNHLSYGYHGEQDTWDDRLSTGEFVMMYIYNDDGSLNSVRRIESIAYNWRLETRGTHSDIRMRLYELLNKTYTDTTRGGVYEKFRLSFPIIPKRASVDVIKEVKEAPLIYIQDGPRIKEENWSSRFYTVWMSLLFSVALHQQVLVADMFIRFIDDKEDVKFWLIELESRGTPISLSEDVMDIIKDARNVAIMESDNRQLENRTERNVVINRRINQVINELDGLTLYRITREMECVLAMGQ